MGLACWPAHGAAPANSAQVGVFAYSLRALLCGFAGVQACAAVFRWPRVRYVLLRNACRYEPLCERRKVPASAPPPSRGAQTSAGVAVCEIRYVSADERTNRSMCFPPRLRVGRRTSNQADHRSGSFNVRAAVVCALVAHSQETVTRPPAVVQACRERGRKQTSHSQYYSTAHAAPLPHLTVQRTEAVTGPVQPVPPVPTELYANSSHAHPPPPPPSAPLGHWWRLSCESRGRSALLAYSHALRCGRAGENVPHGSSPASRAARGTRPLRSGGRRGAGCPPPSPLAAPSGAPRTPLLEALISVLDRQPRLDSAWRPRVGAVAACCTRLQDAGAATPSDAGSCRQARGHPHALDARPRAPALLESLNRANSRVRSRCVARALQCLETSVTHRCGVNWSGLWHERSRRRCTMEFGCRCI